MDMARLQPKITNGFKPFTIHLSDGCALAVPHAGFVALGKNVVVVIGKDERVNTLNPLNITSIKEKLAHK